MTGSVVAAKWRLERVLGVGGMATVYAATHVNNGRPAAIKMLHRELAANPEVRRRFAREGYIANKVGHAGAVAALDDGVDEHGTPFLVMELLDGEPLWERADRSPGGVLSESEALVIADGVLDVLAAAHAKGIVHRDLKPDNVFLMKDGTVRVLDFGIARLREATGADATQTGLLIGTPAYMPPEQARGRAKEIDGRSDLWALGAILFRLLTGKPVHVAETPSEAVLQAMTAHAPPLASVLPRASPAVAEVIDRALAHAQEDRWADASAMQAAARRAREGMNERRSGARRRRRRAAAIAVTLALAGSALAASGVVTASTARDARDAMAARVSALANDVASTVDPVHAPPPPPLPRPAPTTRPKAGARGRSAR
jgi:serine/threonine-protein kinase